MQTTQEKMDKGFQMYSKFKKKKKKHKYEMLDQFTSQLDSGSAQCFANGFPGCEYRGDKE